jgi:hypothetical protein
MGTRGYWTSYGKYVVLWANDGKRCYPNLGFERGRVEGPVRNEKLKHIWAYSKQ